MYYTSSDDASGVQAIGVAVASDPKGPYVDKSSWPLICETDEGGSIDASPFQDSADGRDWLVYHAWDPAGVGQEPGRTMWLSELTWDGDTPIVQPPLKNNPG